MMERLLNWLMEQHLYQFLEYQSMSGGRHQFSFVLFLTKAFLNELGYINSKIVTIE